MNKELFEQQCEQVRKICGPEGWDLYNNSTSDKQAMYMLAEAGELALSVAKEDYSETGLMDDVGDVLVTIVNYCELSGQHRNHVVNLLCLPDHEELREVERHLFASGVVKYLALRDIFAALDELLMLCVSTKLDINECFQLAIDTISKRTGTYTNGVFVKDSQ